MIASNADDASWWPVLVSRLPTDDRLLYDWIVYMREFMAVRAEWGFA
jgi:hypothetical protein